MTKQLSNSEKRRQQAELARLLIEKDFFKKCRGNQAPPAALKFLKRMVLRTKSPAQFQREWNKWTESLFQAGLIWSRLRRDGQTEAAEKLWDSLIEPEFILPGEMPQETTPVTLVMIDPVKTILLIHFLVKMGRTDFEDIHGQYPWWVEGAQGKGSRLKEFLDMRPKVLEAFPSLVRFAEAEYEKEDHGCYGKAFLYAYTHDVANLRSLQQFKENWSTGEKGACRYLHFAGWQRPFCFMLLREWKDPRFFERHTCFRDDLPSPNPGQQPFAFVLALPEKKARDLFRADEQEKIATWEFAMPKCLYKASVDETGFYDFRGLFVGLHPIREHGLWRKRCPGLVSMNTSHGFGAILPAPPISPWGEYNSTTSIIGGKRFLFY